MSNGILEIDSVSDAGVRYQVNLDRLRCDCPNFVEQRSHFAEDDLRRFCKHLIRAAVESGLSSKFPTPVGAMLRDRNQESGGIHTQAQFFLEDIPGENILISRTPDSEWVNVYAVSEEGDIRQFGYNPDEDRWSYRCAPLHEKDILRVMAGIKWSEPVPADIPVMPPQFVSAEKVEKSALGCSGCCVTALGILLLFAFPVGTLMGIPILIYVHANYRSFSCARCRNPVSDESIMCPACRSSFVDIRTVAQEQPKSKKAPAWLTLQNLVFGYIAICVVLALFQHEMGSSGVATSGVKSPSDLAIRPSAYPPPSRPDRPTTDTPSSRSYRERLVEKYGGHGAISPADVPVSVQEVPAVVAEAPLPTEKPKPVEKQKPKPEPVKVVEEPQETAQPDPAKVKRYDRLFGGTSAQGKR